MEQNGPNTNFELVFSISPRRREDECELKISGPVVVPKSVSDMWESLSPDVRAILVASELKGSNGHTQQQQQQQQHQQQQQQQKLDRSDSCTTTPTVMSPSSSLTVSSSSDQTSSLGGGSIHEEESSDCVEHAAREHERCPVSGADVFLSPLERAPENVFAFTKTHTTERTDVVKTPAATITTTTKVVSTSRGWRNIFSLPISYDVNMVSHGTIFDPVNSQLLDATGVHPEGYNTRFAVVDAAVDGLYGDRIRGYFGSRGIVLTTCVIDGGEADKRPAVSCVGSIFGWQYYNTRKKGSFA